MTRTYVEEIEDPVTGQLEVFEAATETELGRLVANAFPQDEADHLAPAEGQTDLPPGGDNPRVASATDRESSSSAGS